MAEQGLQIANFKQLSSHALYRPFFTKAIFLVAFFPHYKVYLGVHKRA
jgi:hypothetical protein